MIDRVILSFLFQYYRALIAIDPNTGNEIGKQEGDKQNKSMGRPALISERSWIILDRTLLFVLAILSVINNKPIGMFDWFLFICGTVGTCLSYWAYHELGQFYTFTLGIRNNHQIISDGPYSYFAHPGYLGQFLVYLSTLLFFRISIFLTIPLCTCVVYLFNKRINAEEEMLRKNFGSDYDEFVSNRWTIIPRINFF
jgi:protein-S-isoprenylcysteine O-methyltransferase Ste14